MPSHVPSFDEWVAYCFEYGLADFYAFAKSSGSVQAEIEAREEHFQRIDSLTLTEYAIKLFSSPAFVADRYSDEQITGAIWFIFSIPSQYFHSFYDDSVPSDLQVSLVKSVATMYTDLFDHLCNRRGTQPDGDFTNTLPVDKAVFMIWDMDGIECLLNFPNGRMHLVEPTLYVLETALFSCRTASCKKSALDGLDQIRHVDPKRVQAIIDRFIALPGQPDHLRVYARNARDDKVL